jgi:hypothetical protein
LAPLGEMAASFNHFFVTRPLDRNGTTKQMETAQIHGENPDHANQQDKILDRGMRDTVSFDAYAHEHGKLK